jgi:hypothetical protein
MIFFDAKLEVQQRIYFHGHPARGRQGSASCSACGKSIGRPRLAKKAQIQWVSTDFSSVNHQIAAYGG